MAVASSEGIDVPLFTLSFLCLRKGRAVKEKESGLTLIAIIIPASYKRMYADGLR